MKKFFNFLLILIFISEIPISAQELFEKVQKQIYDFTVLSGKNEIVYQQNENLRFVDISTLLARKMIPLETDKTITSLANCYNDSIVIAGFTDGTIRIYDCVNNKLALRIEQLMNVVTSIHIAQECNTIAAVSEKGELLIYDFLEKEILARKENLGFLSVAKFIEKGKFLIVAGEKGIMILNSKNGNIISQDLSRNKIWIRDISLEKDERKFISADDKGNISLWNYSEEGIINDSELLSKEKPWISGIDARMSEPEYLLYSTYYGIVKLKMEKEVYSVKRIEMIYDTKLISYEPKVRIAMSIRDRGLAIYELSDMKKEDGRKKKNTEPDVKPAFE